MSVERGKLLFQQSRYDLAEAELRQAIGQEPEHRYARALLALTLMLRGKLKEATSEAQEAIHIAPDYAFAHYALAKTWYARNDYDKSRDTILEAIRLDPNSSDYRFHLAAIHFDEQRFSDALQVAEDGLELDPEDPDCANLRVRALVKLGRGGEAAEVIDATLARDPENAATHANKGWALLHEGNADEALPYFKESLRLNPHLDWARQGIVEAMKARNPVYGMMLRYFLWMSTLSPRTRWWVLFGGYFVSRITGLLALWLLFVLFTWIAEPLFNLILRLDRFGRQALSREQIVESNWIGAGLALSVLSVVVYVVFKQDAALVSAIVFGLLVVPVAGVFHAPLGWPRMVMLAYTGFTALLGLVSVFTVTFGPEFEKNPWAAAFVAFVVFAIFSGWAANYLGTRRVKR